MSILQEFRHDEVRVLDRLVDGELDQPDRQELLAALDDEPGAWRRCALAFLEAQTWRGQMSQVTTAPFEVHSARGITAALPGSGKVGRASWGTWLSIAAALLVAFGLGTRWSPLSRSPEQERLGVAASNGTVPSIGKKAIEKNRATAGAQVDSVTDDGALVETVTLAAVDGADAEEFELSVVKDDATDQQWASAKQLDVASRLLGQLEQAGFKVTRQQQFWPVELADGRRLVVPVDEVNVSDPEIVQF